MAVPHFAPQVSATTPTSLRAAGMSRPDPSWRHIERRKTICLNAIDTFNVDADHAAQVNHMLPSGLSSPCEWDSRYTRSVGSAKSGAKLLSSTHGGWADHAHTVSACMRFETKLPIFYFFEDFFEDGRPSGHAVKRVSRRGANYYVHPLLLIQTQTLSVKAFSIGEIYCHQASERTRGVITGL